MTDSSTDSLTDSGKQEKAKFPAWAKTLAAVLVSLAILAYFFKDLDWQKLWQATAEANLVLAFFAILIPQLIVWLFSVYQTERMFTWYHKPFPWKDFLWFRGGTYLVMMINQAIGAGGIVLYLQKKTKVSWTHFIAIHMFKGSVQAAAVGFSFILLLFIMQVRGVFDSSAIHPYIWLILAVLVGGQLVFWDSWFFFLHKRAIGLTRYFFTSGSVNGELVGGLRNVDHELWSTYRQATKRQWILFIVWAYVPLIAFMAGYWLLALAFNVDIPFAIFLATFLIVLVIQDMPFAFAGFGTTTLAWTMFYADYGSPEALASLTLCLPIMRLGVRAAIGVATIRPAMDEVSEIIKEMKTNEKPKLSDIA